jgi:hypothetical protein
MKNTAPVAGAFLLGIAVASIFFISTKSASISSPAASPGEAVECKAKVIDSCALSKEILPPPKFAADLPGQLETNHEAEVKVAWEPVTGAKAYHISVMTKSGHLVKRYSTTRNTIYLKDIPTPPNTDVIDYKIFLATANASDEDGDKSEARDLKVNKQASVVAPTVKQIVVED